VTSSPRSEASYSTKLARSLIESQKAGDPKTKVIVRDLATNPLPHITSDFVFGLGTPAEDRTAAQRAALALSDELIKEL
jgi:FMN-dependent NADH-azoreductase